MFPFLPFFGNKLHFATDGAQSRDVNVFQGEDGSHLSGRQ